MKKVISVILLIALIVALVFVYDNYLKSDETLDVVYANKTLTSNQAFTVDVGTSYEFIVNASGAYTIKMVPHNASQTVTIDGRQVKLTDLDLYNDYVTLTDNGFIFCQSMRLQPLISAKFGTENVETLSGIVFDLVISAEKKSVTIPLYFVRGIDSIKIAPSHMVF